MARAISKILFILGLYNVLAYLECIRGYAWSKGCSDPDLSSVCKHPTQYFLYRVAQKSKKVFLKSLTFLRSNANTTDFNIECGQGFYVRSLARDLAYKLSTYGHVVELKRTKVGNFNEKTSILLDDLIKIRQSEFEFNCIHSSISMLDDILAYEIEEKKDLNNLSLGKSIFINKKQLIKKPLSSDKEELVFLSNKGNIISFGKLSDDLFKPNKVLV